MTVQDRWDGGLLRDRQAQLVTDWCGDPRLVRDLSWGLVDTRVLQVRAQGRDLVVKAAGPRDHHLGREVSAHSGPTAALLARGLTAPMLHHDLAARVLVLRHQTGVLVQGSDRELDPDLHEQAGRALRVLHGPDRGRRVDDGYEARATARTLRWLDGSHRIDADVEAELRGRLREHRPGPVEVVDTHGDWQPRNWLHDAGTLRVIDFGRYAVRPAASDLCRLAAQQWLLQPWLQDAFRRGYGGDPRGSSEADRRDGSRGRQLWRMHQLREAVGTAVWAHQVGDEAFAAQGHAMIAAVLQKS